MFAKLFRQFLNSTVNELDLHVRWTFVGLLLLCDDVGTVDMTILSIARAINLPEAQVAEGIEELMRPDPLSRTPDEEGRRIVPIREGYGWQIVNFAKYRELRRETDRREYMAGYMRDYRAKRKQKSSRGANARSREQGALAKSVSVSVSSFGEREVRAVFGDLWEHVPKKEGKKAAYRHFLAEARASGDLEATRIRFAKGIAGYCRKLQLEKIEPRHTKHGDTLFSNIDDYVDWQSSRTVPTGPGNGVVL